MAKAPQAADQGDADTGHQGILDSTGEGFTFDMSSQVEDSGFPVAPQGTYDLVVDNLTYGLSQSSGNPMWTLSLLITGGPSDPDGEIAKKEIKVRAYQVFKPDQMGRAKRLINCIDPSVGTVNFNPKKIADDKVLIGKPLRARLNIRKSEEYGDQNNVVAYLPAGGGSAGGEGAGGFAM
jgi:hypothetical protein